MIQDKVEEAEVRKSINQDQIEMKYMIEKMEEAFKTNILNSIRLE